jgi:hypothetical protein
MPEVAFVMSEDQQYPLRELAGTLGYELELQSVPSALHLGGFPAPGIGVVYVLVDPKGYVAREGPEALPPDGILRRTIFLCTGPPPSAADAVHIALLQRGGAVFVLDQRSVAAMHRLGIPARLLRPGYSKSLDRFDAAAARPIDVMFLGRHSLRRTMYLGRAARVLSRHNCLLQVSEDVPSRGDTSSFLGAGRWPLLAQTKVLINLHRDDGSRFDWRGAVDAIHAGAVVVSEHSSGFAPLIPGEHLVVAGADALPYVVEHLLEDEDRLARLRSQAYQRLRDWIPYALSVAVLRAAVVELVGEPVHSGTALGKLRTKPAVAEASVPGAAEERIDGTGRPTLKSVHVHVARESRAWTSRRAPLVTAVMAARGRHEEVVATLNSLARSRMRDFELVVVVSEKSESAAEVLESWISDHPRIPARLVVSDPSGLGAARNIGIDFARGSFILVLDPGQELYPRCLEVLTGTLDAMPGMAFVYPMQEVTGAPDDFVEAGGDYLLSYLGWDPRRLRAGNVVHAPALIRTDLLRVLGGFTTDPRLEGFEDYDLWCRIADRGWRGQLAPQELARRTESGSSPALSTIHPSPGDATTALMARAPKLMGGAFNGQP